MTYHRVLDQPFKDPDFSSNLYEPGFELDHFQKHAISCIKKNENVLVTAHTGSGKTVPAIFGISDSLKKNRKIIYTSPIKSLSNQKFFELSQQFPDVGILTGDIKYNPDAQCVIMTTEILRNILYQKTTTHVDIAEVDKVIFDEVHYINDPDRGKVWEECFILMPSEITLIMLSATIDKAEDFAKWIGSIKGKMTNLIPTSHRVVPLEHYFYNPENIGNQLVKVVSSKGEFLNFNEIRKTYKKYPISKIINPFIDYLKDHNSVPALFFVFSRKECERLASSVQRSLVTSDEISEIVKIFDYEMRHHREVYQSSKQYHEIRSMVQKGIAYHHSGLVPILKEVVEILFGKGLVKVLFATETFAVGVNMPTKTVIFPKLSKYSNGDFRFLRTDEYLQMAGRAGRRGLDKTGTVVILPTDEIMPYTGFKSMALGKSPSIQSKFKLSYQFILKILRNRANNGNDTSEEETLDISKFMNKSLLSVDNSDRIKSYQREKVELQEGNKLDLTTDEKKAIIEYHNAIRKMESMRGNVRKRESIRLEKVKREMHNFNSINKKYETYIKNKERIKILNSGIKNLETYLDKDTQLIMKYLIDNNYIVCEDEGEGEDRPKILTRGIIASEISECNEITLTEMIVNDILIPLEPEEIVAVLATFIEEKTNETYWSDLDVSESIKNALSHIEYGTKDFEQYEVNLGIDIGTDWNLYLSFIQPAYDWACGRDILEMHKKYEIYEGTFIRNILRINNIVDNIKNIADTINKPELMKKLELVERLLVRDQVTTDSLYITKSA